MFWLVLVLGRLTVHYDLTRIITAKNSYLLSILLIKLHKLPKIGIIHNLQEHLISQTIQVFDKLLPT
jgi:hypothetical protein